MVLPAVRDAMGVTVKDVAIAELLDELGFSGAVQADARAVLEASGLTNARKTRITRGKTDAIERALDAAFARRCEECAADGGDARPIVLVRAGLCGSCGGSATRREAQRLSAALTHPLRVLVVGGSPEAHRLLTALDVPQVVLRLVDGKARQTADRARADAAWADVIVIWASTQLDHKVSTLYVETPAAAGKRITVGRRGIAAMLAEVRVWLRQHRA